MVTNNAPFCHRHLRVKVKKHICRVRTEDAWIGEGNQGYRKGGWEGGGRTMMKERRKGELPFEIENRKELIYWGWTPRGGFGGDGGGWTGRMGIQD